MSPHRETESDPDERTGEAPERARAEPPEPARELDLARRLREADEAGLERILADHREQLDGPALRQLFRNPFLSRRIIESLIAVAELAATYEFRLEAARHPRTSQPVALAYVGGLFWPDLIRIGLDTHLHPVVRRAADLRIAERLPGLAVGEKIAIARTGSQTVIGALRTDPTPRVIEALLENPRLTEGLLLPLVAGDGAPARVLAVVAASGRWSVRYPVRLALCRNPRTPPDLVLSHLAMLKKGDLQAVARDHRLTLPVRRRAELLARGREQDGGI
jgi:hypothetical protein